MHPSVFTDWANKGQQTSWSRPGSCKGHPVDAGKPTKGVDGSRLPRFTRNVSLTRLAPNNTRLPALRIILMGGGVVSASHWWILDGDFTKDCLELWGGENPGMAFYCPSSVLAEQFPVGGKGGVVPRGV